MSRQYHNMIERLRAFNMQVNTSEEEYKKDQKRYLQLYCTQGHITNIQIGPLQRKLAQFEKKSTPHYQDPQNFCNQCGKKDYTIDIKNKCKELGFKFIDYSDGYVNYVCTCGKKVNIQRSSLMCKINSGCAKCHADKYKHDADAVADYFKEQGCELLSKYENRITPLTYRCVCGYIAEILYHNFVYGQRCEKCKITKYKACMQKQREAVAEEIIKIRAEAEAQLQAHEQTLDRPKVGRSVKYKGFTWIVQGYTPYCIKELLKNFEPHAIIAGQDPALPVCKYVYKNKRKIWRPDIYLPSIGRVILVRKIDEYNKTVSQIKAKMIGCAYDCELRLYAPDKTIFEIISHESETGEIKYYYEDKVVLGKKIVENSA